MWGQALACGSCCIELAPGTFRGCVAATCTRLVIFCRKFDWPRLVTAACCVHGMTCGCVLCAVQGAVRQGQEVGGSDCREAGKLLAAVGAVRSVLTATKLAPADLWGAQILSQPPPAPLTYYISPAQTVTTLKLQQHRASAARANPIIQMGTHATCVGCWQPPHLC